MRRLLAVGLVVLFAVACGAQAHASCKAALQQEAPLTRAQQFCWYGAQRLSLMPFVTAAGTAAFSQWRDEPPEWKQGGEAFGKRFGSSYAAGAAADTAQLLTDLMLNEDPRFITLGKGSFAARFAHSLGYTLVARNGRGHRELALGRLAGAAASGFVPNVWYPIERSAAADGAERMGYALGGYAFSSLLAEFKPELRRLFHRKAKP